MSDTSEITVPTADFLKLIGDARQAACLDGALPNLNGVMLHTAEDNKGRAILVGTATDRFCAVQVKTHCAGQLDRRVFLRPTQLDQMGALLRPYASRKRVGTAETSIGVDGDTVTVRQLSLDTLAKASLGFKHEAAETFPDIDKLFGTILKQESSADCYHVAGAKMLMFARISASRDVPMRVRSSGPGKAVVIQVGPDVLGLAMPVRVGEEATAPIAVPVYAPPAIKTDALDEKAVA